MLDFSFSLNRLFYAFQMLLQSSFFCLLAVLKNKNIAAFFVGLLFFRKCSKFVHLAYKIYKMLFKLSYNAPVQGAYLVLTGDTSRFPSAKLYPFASRGYFAPYETINILLRLLIIYLLFLSPCSSIEHNQPLYFPALLNSSFFKLLLVRLFDAKI